MLKNILKMEGVQVLDKVEQRNLKGGSCPGTSGSNCNPAEECCIVCRCGTNNIFRHSPGTCPAGYDGSGSYCA